MLNLLFFEEWTPDCWAQLISEILCKSSSDHSSVDESYLQKLVCGSQPSEKEPDGLDESASVESLLGTPANRSAAFSSPMASKQPNVLKGFAILASRSQLREFLLSS